MKDFWDGKERRGAASDNYIRLEELLFEVKNILTDHIAEERDLIPTLKEMVATWKAANWLLNVVKWLGVIAGSILALIAIIKGIKE
jgi:hypothetical protein